MRKLAGIIAASIIGAAALVSPANAAQAVDFTVNPDPAVVNTVTELSAVTDCTTCRIQWREYRLGINGRPSTDRLGSTLGEGQTIRVVFSSTGYHNVQVKVTYPGPTNRFDTWNKYVTVVSA
jgi:hypothetical protein